MRFILLLIVAASCSGCAVLTPAYVDQNSLMIGRLQGEVDALRAEVYRGKYVPTPYLK